MSLTFTLLQIALGLYLLCMGAAIWQVGQLLSVEWQTSKHQREIEVLERMIVEAQLLCAARNPDAARILIAKEKCRKLPASNPDYRTYRKFWAAHLGGEPIDSIQDEEAARCDTAD